MKRKAGDAIPDLLSDNKEKVFSSGSFREILQNFGRLVITVSLK